MPDFAKAMSGKHKPVLLHESIDALDLEANETFLDGTLGAGGHSLEVLRRLRGKVRIIGLDRDPSAIARVRGEHPEIEISEENFANLDRVLHEKDISSVDAILFDLGFSSDQVGGLDRGFSFQRNEPLDMRMSKTGLMVADILNSWDEHAIELVLRGFGEEKFSRKIAREIVERRKVEPLKTTFELVEAVEAVKPKSFRDKIPARPNGRSGRHPATKTFQALRIAVNEELTSLELGLEKGFNALGRRGRFAVISFHSLEDRIVKNFFRDKVKEGMARQINKKPIVPSASEIEANPRSRSAKLRVIEKI